MKYNKIVDDVNITEIKELINKKYQELYNLLDGLKVDTTSLIDYENVHASRRLSKKVIELENNIRELKLMIIEFRKIKKSDKKTKFEL